VLKQWSDKAYREAGKGDNIKEFAGVKAKKIDKKKQGSASFSRLDRTGKNILCLCAGEGSFLMY